MSKSSLAHLVSTEEEVKFKLLLEQEVMEFIQHVRGDKQKPLIDGQEKKTGQS